MQTRYTCPETFLHFTFRMGNSSMVAPSIQTLGDHLPTYIDDGDGDGDGDGNGDDGGHGHGHALILCCSADKRIAWTTTGGGIVRGTTPSQIMQPLEAKGLTVKTLRFLGEKMDMVE